MNGGRDGTCRLAPLVPRYGASLEWMALMENSMRSVEVLGNGGRIR